MLWARVYLLWLFRLVPMPSGGCTRSCYWSSWVRSAAVGQLGGLCPLCPPDSTSSQRRQQRREPESRAAQSISRMLLWVQLNEGSSSSWLCWCSTTLLRKLIAGLKQGSTTHCRADQMIPTWKRWAVHMWTVIHRLVWFVLNCFSRDDWLVSSAKYFLGEEFL